MKDKEKYQKLKVVFVDWHRTLCSLPLFHELLVEDEVLFDKLDTRLFDDMPIALFIEWMRGKFSKEEVVRRLAGEDLSVDFVREKLKSSCEAMYFDRKEFMPLIEKIRKSGRKVVIATDNIDTFCEYTAPALKLDEKFDDILSSFEIKCLKEDIKDGEMLFFKNFLCQNDIKADEAILLDDSVKTIKSCKNCGMQAKQIKRPEDVIKTLKKIAECDE